MQICFGKTASTIEKISGWSGWVSSLFMLLMMPVITYEVIMRYVFDNAPMIADEFGGYFLVAVTFIGLAYTMKEKGHIRVEMVTSKLSARGANWLRLFTLFVALVVTGVLTVETIAFVRFSIRLGLKSESWLMVPSYIPQIVMPIGVFLFFLQIMVETAKTIKALCSPESVLPSPPSETSYY